MDNTRLQQIYDNAGRPGAQAFRDSARRAGIQISAAEARAFVAQQSEGQVFQARIPSDGKVLSSGREDTRWQLDLIDFSKRIAKINRGHKYVLIAVDNYNRQVFTKAMSSKSANETLEKFKAIIRANGNVMPKEITTDLGNEFALVTAEIESRGGVHRRKNMHAVNTIALVDNRIKQLKAILSGMNLTQWADSLKKATDALNERNTAPLMFSAPNDVKGSAELQYEIERKHGEDIKHNNVNWKKKVGQLRDRGAFRTPLPRESWERVDQPKWGGKVYMTDSFKGANVEDAEGRSFPVKTSLPVPGTSQDVDIQIEAGPGGGKRAKQREMLQDYAQNLKDLLPSTGYTLARVVQIIKGMRGAEDTMDVYGPSRAGRYTSFLKLFPKLFEISGSGGNIRVLPKAPEPPRAVQPRPMQVGGSSSSSAVPAPATPRTPREPYSIETPYRRFPNELRIEFGPNPARRGTPRFGRYEKYKEATTIGGVRRLGATPQDISSDLAAGAMRIL